MHLFVPQLERSMAADESARDRELAMLRGKCDGETISSR